MVDVRDPRLNVVNLMDGIVWRLGKLIRRFPFYDQINSKTLVRQFCSEAAERHADMPQEIDVETVNRCNSDCRFCPANVKDDPRTTTYMPDQLILKIAAELAAEKYCGIIAPFGNNEPLIDKRICEIIGIFRKSCPGAEIFLCTNGILLTAERYFSLFDAGLSHLVINNYNNRAQFTGNISSVLEQILESKHEKLKEYLGMTAILLRNKHEILNSRAGEAPNKLKSTRYKHYQRNSCMYPYRQMSILSDGRVSICCEDFTGRISLGNIGEETIRSVWNGERFRAVRRELQTNGRLNILTCKHCDYGHLGAVKAKTLIQYFVKWFSKF